jgi:hypothetical protein
VVHAGKLNRDLVCTTSCDGACVEGRVPSIASLLDIDSVFLSTLAQGDGASQAEVNALLFHNTQAFEHSSNGLTVLCRAAALAVDGMGTAVGGGEQTTL